MERSGSLGGIRSKIVVRGRNVLLKKVLVKSVRNLGAVGIGNGPESNQITLQPLSTVKNSQLTT
jgi:hypothetical protein